MQTISDYERWKAERQMNGAAAATIVVGATDAKPDEVAGDLNLAGEFGKVTGNPVPPLPMVREYRNVFQQRIEQERAKTVLSMSPKLAEWLRDPENAAISRDNLEGLSWWETTLGAGENAVSRGVMRLPQSYNQFMANMAAQRAQDANRSIGDILSEETAIKNAAGEAVGNTLIPSPADVYSAGSRWFSSRFSSLLSDQKTAAAEYQRRAGEYATHIASIKMSPVGERYKQAFLGLEPTGSIADDLRQFMASAAADPAGFAAFLAETAVESAPSLAVATAATLATRNPVVGAGVLGSYSGAIEAGVAPVEFFAENGVDVSTPEGAMAAISNPDLMRKAVERGLTRGVIIGIMDGLSGGIAGQQLAKSPLANVALQSIVQAAFGAGGEAGAQLAAGQEFNIAEVMLEGLAEFVTAPIEVAGVGGRGFIDGQRKAREAEQRKAMFEELSGKAVTDPVRARMPDKFREFVARATEGGPVENVYVPADQFVQYFQGIGVDPFALVDELDGVTRDDLDVALAAGADLQIPTATYAAKIAGSDHDAFLMENMRFDPDEFTAREAAEFNAKAQDALEEAWSVAEELRVQQEELRSFEQEIYDTMVSRLRAAGRSTDVATTEAMLYPAFYRVMAERSQMTVEDFMRQYPLPQVKGDLPEGMQLRDVDALNRTLAEARSRRAAGLEKRGPSLLEFISERGGINDVGGELRARDAETIKRGKGKKTLRLARGGVTAGVRDMFGGSGAYGVDDVAQAAIEAGYLADDPDVLAWQEAQRNGTVTPDITRALWAAIDRELAGEPVYAGEATVEPDDGMDQIEAYLAEIGASLDDDDATIRAAIEADQAGRQYGQGDEKNLIVQHNLTAANLLHADKMRGLAVPSLAISNVDHPLDNFGEITLIGGPDLIDPRKDSAAKVFDADVYSPRYPTVRYKIAQPVMRKAWKRLAKVSNELGHVLSSEIDDGEVERKGLEAFRDSSAVQLQFLRDTGRNIDLPQNVARTDYLKLVPELIELGHIDQYGLEHVPGVKEAVERAISLNIQRLRDAAPDIPVEEWQNQFYFRGEIRRSVIEDIKQEKRVMREPGVDRSRARHVLRDAIAPHADEFAAWVDKEFGPTLAGETIVSETASGNWRYLPHTLDNVVKVLRKKLRDGEGFNYGVGSIRSTVANQFRSVSAIQRARGRLIPSDAMQAVKDEVDQEFIALAGKLGAYSDFSDGFGWLDTFSEQLKEMAERGPRSLKQYFRDLPDDLVNEAGAFLQKLANMPSEYFEAKLQRAVDLSEFKAAVIPSNASKEVRDVLKYARVPTFEYDRSSEGARAEAIRQAGEQGQLLFQPAYHGTGHLFDKFSMDRVGTGEGNQSYGYGLYFSSRKDIAEFYRNSVSQKTGADGGRLFTVDVPDAGELLNWDAPISEQTPEVIEKLKSAIAKAKPGLLANSLRKTNYRKAQDMLSDGAEAALGKDFYGALKRALGGFGNKDNYLATKALAEVGLPGHSYRGFEGAENFVIYDDSRVNVVSYEQNTGGPRGSIQFPGAGVGNGDTVIRLFQSADLSTMLHESGHYFLTVMRDLATKGEPAAAQDFDAVKAWWRSNADAVAKDANRVAPMARGTLEQGPNTDAFRKWFGASKVVDDKGEPLVVYHGTRKGGFDRFNTEGGTGKTFGTGAFFTESLAGASTYSNSKKLITPLDVGAIVADPEEHGFTVEQDGEEFVATDPDGNEWISKDRDQALAEIASDYIANHSSEDGNYAVYLSLQNPLVIDAEGQNWDSIGGKEWFVEDADGEGLGWFTSQDELDEFLSSYDGDVNDLKIIESNDNPAADSTDDIARRAREEGYDGVIIENVTDEGPFGQGYGWDNRIFIAFDPAQIKSVNNRGTFDANDPRILYQDRKKSLDELIAEMRARRETRERIVAALASGTKSTRMESDSGLRAFVGPNTVEGERPFRISYFDAKGEPTGHSEYDTYEKALDDAVTYGYRPIDRAGVRILYQEGSNLKGGERVTVTAEDVIRAIDTGSSGDTIKDMLIDVGMQEQFARGFEQYLMEGKAPSTELRTAFEKFRAWLISVYQRIAGLNVNVSDDIRAVFDRMLASDAEIAKAKADIGDTGPLFPDAGSIGLTPDEYAAFLKLRSQAEDDAKARLLREAMAPVKRAQEQWFKDERAKVRDEIERQINAGPAYRAIEWMGNRRWLGEGQPEDMPDIRMSKDILVQRYGEGVLKTLPRGKQTVYAVEGGIDPDDAAGWFGFDSGDAMIRAMEQMPPRREAIEAETDKVMRERHGDPLNDGSIEAAALDAVHTDKRGQWIAAELKAVAEVAGVDVAMTNKEARATARQIVSRMKVRDAMNANRFLSAERKAADEAAKLGAILAREGVWLQNAKRRLEAQARKAAKGQAAPDTVATAVDAFNAKFETTSSTFTVPNQQRVSAKGNAYTIPGGERTVTSRGYNDLVRDLIAAKRRQLLNHALYMEARKVADEVEKAERFVAKLGKKSHREKIAGAGRRDDAQVDHLAAIDEIIERYDFRKLSGRAEQRRGALNDFMEAMKAAGRENELAIPETVLRDAARKPYKTLPVEELRGVIDSLKNLEHIALRWDKLIDAQQQRELEAVAADIVGAFDANLPKRPPGRVGSKSEARRTSVRQFLDLVLNAGTLLREIDGFADLGPAYRNLKSPIDAAMNRLISRKEKAAVDLEALYAVYSKDERRRMSVREHVPALGYSLSKWEKIAVALNTGNDGNFQRLTDSKVRGSLTEDQVAAVLATLDQRDAKFVQSVWDYIGSFREDIAARERRTTGVEPEWVEPRPVTIAGQQLRGGYYPLKYDPRLSSLARDDQTQEIAQSLQAGRFGKAQTRNGHLKERAQSSGRDVELDMSVLHRHVNQVVYDLELSEPVANSWRILQNSQVRQAFMDAGRQADFDALETWLKDVAEGELRSADLVGRASRSLKSNFTAAKLAFNLSTVAVQVTGLAQTMVIVGKKDFVRGVQASMRRGVGDEIAAKSAFMRQRQTTFNKDIYDFYNDPKVGPAASKWGEFKQSILGPLSFWLMTKVQWHLVDIPTWLGAYEQGLRKFGNDETKAIDHADAIVKRAQASGLFSDRSAVERGSVSRTARQNDVVRLFTTLGSYMFAKFNVAYERSARSRRVIADEGMSMRSAQEALSWTLDMAFLFTLEAVLLAAIKGGLPDGEDDEDEGWAAFLAHETAFSVMGTIPFVRDVASTMGGFEGGGAYGAITKEFAAPFKQAAQGEIDAAFVKSIINATGLATGLPSTQINRIVSAAWREAEGEDVSPLEYILGRGK